MLGALGLIFLPIIFDFVDPQQVDTATKVPPMPNIQPIDLQPATLPPEEDDQPVVVEAVKPPDTVREEPISLDANNLPNAWYVQVASFPEKGKAEDLIKQLSKAGFDSHISAAKVEGKTYYRVAVGPKIDKRTARVIKVQIDQQFGTDAILTQYQP